LREPLAGEASFWRIGFYDVSQPMRRLVMLCLAAMSASSACVAILFLYALIAPTRPAPSIAIAVTMPDADWRGGPVEDWNVGAADQPFVTLASDNR
jgi:hypothetical protein